eukprot:10810193-Karenia_brevis.AAC.1
MGHGDSNFADEATTQNTRERYQHHSASRKSNISRFGYHFKKQEPSCAFDLVYERSHHDC